MFFSNLYEKDVDFDLGVTFREWERKETKQGVLYYVNHREKVSQWDHPHFKNLQKLLSACDDIKYAAYRTAKKISVLQCALLWKEVRLETSRVTLECNGLLGNLPEVHLDSLELLQLFKDILQSATRKSYRPSKNEYELAAELSLNLFLSVYDSRRKGQLKLPEVKVFVTVMSFCGRLQDKLRFLFSQFADHNLLLCPKWLSALLGHVARIPEHLSEGLTFGTPLISAAIKSCFDHKVHPEPNMGLTEDDFIQWMLCEPQLITWWSTLYRMQAAANVLHEVSCGVCGAYPIQGLRYQCLRCLRFDLCQGCFLVGKKARGHKNNHPVLEHCMESSHSTTIRAVLKLLWHWLRGRTATSSNHSRRFLPLDPSSSSCEGQLSILEEAEAPPPPLLPPPAEEWPSRTLLPLDETGSSEEHQWKQLEGVLQRLQEEVSLLEAHSRGLRKPLPQTLRIQLEHLQGVIQGLQGSVAESASDSNMAAEEQDDVLLARLVSNLEEAFPKSVETETGAESTQPLLQLVNQMGDHLATWLTNLEIEKL